MTIEMKMDERFEDGKKIGKAEGKAEGKVEAVLELLEEYGSIPRELMTKVMTEENLDTLKKWHKLAAKVDSIEAFTARM